MKGVRGRFGKEKSKGKLKKGRKKEKEEEGTRDVR